MSTEQIWVTNSTSSAVTEKLGEQLGKRLRGNEVIELISDLGGGKTTLVRGLARGMGSHDQIASPTFMLSKIYKAGALELHHFDFYRLDQAGLMEHELADSLHDPSVVTVVEWGNVVQRMLPNERISIRFEPTADDKRQITISYPSSLGYILEGLQ